MRRTDRIVIAPIDEGAIFLEATEGITARPAGSVTLDTENSSRAIPIRIEYTGLGSALVSVSTEAELTDGEDFEPVYVGIGGNGQRHRGWSRTNAQRLTRSRTEAASHITLSSTSAHRGLAALRVGWTLDVTTSPFTQTFTDGVSNLSAGEPEEAVIAAGERGDPAARPGGGRLAG